jgi:hypothetical protein
MNGRMEIIQAAWQSVSDEFNKSPGLRRFARGDIKISHYKALLRQIYHHTRENPQLQALVTVYFRGRQRHLVRRFFQHATSEVGHDQLALNDLKTLGEDVSRLPFERPIPATMALLGYAFYQVQHMNPIGYLGYLFHLEFTPTQHGERYMQLLEGIGVPRAAMTFLHDHTTVDIGHNKLMETYVDELIATKDDLECVLYAMRVTGQLYANMVQAVFEQVDKPELQRQDYGIAPEEVRLG